MKHLRICTRMHDIAVARLLCGLVLILATSALAAAAGQPAAKTIVERKITAQNKAVNLTVSSVVVRDRVGDLAAAPGRQFLVVSTTWENATAPDAAGRVIPYRVSPVRDFLYAVVNGRELGRISDRSARVKSSLSASLSIGKAPIQGDAIFDISDAQITSLDLRFYDNQKGHMLVPLLPKSAGADAKPVGEMKQNGLLEAGIFQMKKAQQFGQFAAPEGQQFLILDFRGRSLMRLRNGQDLTVCDWPEWRKYAAVIIDGECAYSPTEQSSLTPIMPPGARFLPDATTGGQLVFLVPQKYQSMELRCEFPGSSSPDPKLRKPQPLLFALEGVAPQLPERPSIASGTDQVFRVNIWGRKVASEHAGQKLGGGRQFLIIDVSVLNTGQNGEWFQVRSQLRFVSADNRDVFIDPACTRGNGPAMDPMWVPSGQQRTFQLAYQIDRGEAQARIKLVGAKSAQVLALGPIEPAAAAPASAIPGVTVARRTYPNVIKAGDTLIHDPSLKPRGIAGVGLTAEQVNRAIDKGRAYLWADFKKTALTPKWTGSKEHLLVCLALMHCDAQRVFPEFDGVVRRLLGNINPDSLGNYEAPLVMMSAEYYGDAAYKDLIRTIAMRVLNSQGKNGSFSYNWPRGTVPRWRTGPASAGVAAEATLARTAAWTAGVDGDNSATQYAVLALWCASRSGLRVDPEVWSRCLAETAYRQNDDGGWAYTSPAKPYGSMTAAGIGTSSLCMLHLGREPFDDASVRRGLAWMVRNWSVSENPGNKQYHYYYLYGLERLGSILGTEFIGPNEWYPLGARFLVDSQKPDGSWSKDDRVHDTCFALLFLTRATGSLLKRETLPGTLQTLSPEFSVIDASGKVVAKGNLGESRTLPAGTYMLHTMVGDSIFEKAITIPEGSTIRVAPADLIRSGLPTSRPASTQR